MKRYFYWLFDIDKPFNFLIIYIFITYGTVFLINWLTYGLTNITIYGKIINVLVILLFFKKCVYNYFKEKRNEETD